VRQAGAVPALPVEIDRGVAAGRGTAGGRRAFWPRPRVRRALDGVRLVVSAAALAGLVALAAAAPDGLAASADLLPGTVTGLVRTLVSVANVVASFAVLCLLVAIVVDAVRWRRFALTSAILASLVALLAAVLMRLLVTQVAGPAAGSVLLGPRDESAGLPVALAIAFVVGADLQRRRWLRPVSLALAVAVGCAVALGSLTPPGAAYAALLGTTAGLAVRVAVGVVPARPSAELVRSVLDRAGYRIRDLREVEQTAGLVRYVGERADSDPLAVSVIDPDWRGVPFTRRAWRVLWLRSAAVGRPALSMRGQVEREALIGALAESAGVPMPRVLALLAAGPALVQVEQPLRGTPLPAAPLPERAAESAWRALRKMHDASLAHGALTADAVTVLPDGRAGFSELAAAQPAATELQRELDVVALLVALAGQLGPEAAVTALRAGYGSGPVMEARLAALLQPLALTRAVRRSVRATPLLEGLRAALRGPDAPAVHVGEPRLERLRARTVISIVGGTAAAYVLAGQLSTVDVAGALAAAQLQWLGVALVGAALTYVGAALTRIAFTPTPIPLVRTAMVQLASSFLTLVTPPAVGHVGLNIRYLQRSGVPTATAAGVIAVSEGVTIAVTVVIAVVAGWLSGVSGSRLALLPSGNVLVVMAVAGVLLGLALALPFTRRLIRNRLEPLVRSTIPQLVTAASDPRRLGIALAGITVLNGGYILALDASLQAFSTSVPLPTLIVVYLAASTIGNAAPTPGGLGAVEAALVAGLTATGVPLASAVPAVLAFRAATFWLPAPIGWLAFIGLQRGGRI
jgi:glycosyltransferase 2 family protein